MGLIGVPQAAPAPHSINQSTHTSRRITHTHPITRPTLPPSRPAKNHTLAALAFGALLEPALPDAGVHVEDDAVEEGLGEEGHDPELEGVGPVGGARVLVPDEAHGRLGVPRGGRDRQGRVPELGQLGGDEERRLHLAADAPALVLRVEGLGEELLVGREFGDWVGGL